MMAEQRTPVGYRVCTCGHTLMQHSTFPGPGGVCTIYPCECMEFDDDED